MQINNRLLDDLARVASGALGVAVGAKGEVEALLRQRFERILTDMDLVSREEFEAVKAMAVKARVEQEALAERLALIEAAQGAAPAAKGAKGRGKSAAGPKNPPSRE
jgi:BMFP domain-containing protein YqiC